MAKVLIAQNNVSFTYGTSVTAYSIIPGAQEAGAETTEANAQIPFSVAGTFSRLYVRVAANSITATTTRRLRVNGANGNNVVSIGSSATGEFTDASNADVILADDDVNYQIVTGATGTTIEISIASIIFGATTNTLMKWGGTGGTGGTAFTSVSTTTFHRLSGGVTTTETTEADAQSQINSAGTWQHLFTYISANTRTDTFTIKSRKNAADGNQVLSIATTTTGAFEDTSNTDSIIVNDLLNYSLATDIGINSITVQHVSSEYLTTNNTFTSVLGERSGVNMASDVDTLNPIGGSIRRESIAESLIATDTNLNANISNLWLYASANTLNGNTPFTLRRNQADTSVTISITASTTGAFEDTTNTAVFIPTDEINILGDDNSTAGNMTYKNISILFTVTSGFLSKLALLGAG